MSGETLGSNPSHSALPISPLRQADGERLRFEIDLPGYSVWLRQKQELLLAIGGWRLLAAFGVQPDICHLNKGHAAFAVRERAHGFMQATAHPFAAAFQDRLERATRGLA